MFDVLDNTPRDKCESRLYLAGYLCGCQQTTGDRDPQRRAMAYALVGPSLVLRTLRGGTDHHELMQYTY